jgi:hypothetical protein
MSNSRRKPRSPTKGDRPKWVANQLPTSRGNLGTSALAVIAVIGFLIALLSLLPRITVTPSDPVDPTDALSALFTSTNSAFVPLRKVSVTLGLGEIQPAR